MDEQTHRPLGLNPRQMKRLEEHVRHGPLLAPERLLQMAYAHLEDVQGEHSRHPEIDTELAEAICHTVDRIVSEWDSFSPVEQSWLRGSIQYFAISEDEQPDLQAGGFNDDLEVLNACLRYVQREDWIREV